MDLEYVWNRYERRSSDERSRVKGVYRCPQRNNLQSKSVEAKPYRYWGLLDCHCHWRAPRRRSLEDRQETYPLQATEMAIKSSSVRRKSQTLAWQRSTSSTKKAAMHLQWCSLSATAAAGVMAAVMVGDATVAEVAITAAVAMVAAAAVVAAVSALGWVASAGGVA